MQKGIIINIIINLNIQSAITQTRQVKFCLIHAGETKV